MQVCDDINVRAVPKTKTRRKLKRNNDGQFQWHYRDSKHSVHPKVRLNFAHSIERISHQRRGMQTLFNVFVALLTNIADNVASSSAGKKKLETLRSSSSSTSACSSDSETSSRLHPTRSKGATTTQRGSAWQVWKSASGGYMAINPLCVVDMQTKRLCLRNYE